MDNRIIMTLSAFLVLCSEFLIAGSSGGGGGTPPAREQLLESIMRTPGAGGLYVDREVVALGVNNKLPDQLILRSRNMSSFSLHKLIAPAAVEASIVIPESDLNALVESAASQESNIVAENLDGEIKTYAVEPGSEPDSLLLKDISAEAGSE